MAAAAPAPRRRPEPRSRRARAMSAAACSPCETRDDRVTDTRGERPAATALSRIPINMFRAEVATAADSEAPEGAARHVEVWLVPADDRVHGVVHRSVHHREVHALNVGGHSRPGSRGCPAHSQARRAHACSSRERRSPASRPMPHARSRRGRRSRKLRARRERREASAVVACWWSILMSPSLCLKARSSAVMASRRCALVAEVVANRAPFATGRPGGAPSSVPDCVPSG